MSSSAFPGAGHDLDILVLIFKDCSGFLNFDLSNFVSSSGFLCFVYDFFGVALNFYIMTS